MGVTKKPLDFFYQLNNHILEQVQDNPYLGILINENLKWTTHINKITSKASSTLGFIRRNLKHCPRKLKETAYFSLIRSVLDYASTIWDPYLVKDINRLESVQRRAARFVCNNYHRDTSVSHLLTELKWTSLADRRREQRLILHCKIINGLIEIPSEPHVTHSKYTRNSNSKGLNIIRSNTETFRNSFFPRSVKDWNNLPDSCVLSPSVDSFKGALAKVRLPPAGHRD